MRALLALLLLSGAALAQAPPPSRYAVVCSGAVENVTLWQGAPTFAAPAGCTWVPDPQAQAAIGGTWTGTAFTAPAPSAPTPATTLTRTQFIALFTPTEQVAIATAGQTNPAVLIWMINLTDTVDLTDPLTQQGVQAMVTAGLITQARATAILAGQ